MVKQGSYSKHEMDLYDNLTQCPGGSIFLNQEFKESSFNPVEK